MADDRDKTLLQNVLTKGKTRAYWECGGMCPMLEIVEFDEKTGEGKFRLIRVDPLI